MKNIKYQILNIKYAILLALLLTFSIQAQNRTTDSLALVTVYDSLGGASWTTQTNWKSGSSIDTWYGVTVTSNRVTDLNLSSNNLSGQIPGAIGDLTGLKYLYMWSNNLTGILPGKTESTNEFPEGYYAAYPPPEKVNVPTGSDPTSNNIIQGKLPSKMGSLTSLIELDLAWNQIGGTIPASFSNLTNLWKIDLNGNNITSMNTLTSLPNLGRIHLSYNQLTSIPSNIDNVVSLETLEISTNQLTSLPVQLANLANLRYLYVGNNDFGGTIPSVVTALVNLLTLDISTLGLDDSDMSAVSGLVNLTNFYASSNLLTAVPDYVGTLSSLYGLSMSYNQITSDQLSPIANLTGLGNLYLAGNQLTTFPMEIFSNTNLFYLQLHQNNITGTIPTEFWSLSNLYYVYLGYNQLQGEIPDSILNITNLNRFQIEYNQMDRLPDLSSLTNLGYLNVQGNRLTFADIEPNIGIPYGYFYYSPQDSIGVGGLRVEQIGDNIEILENPGGTATSYSWYKDEILHSEITGPKWVFTNLSQTDNGTYRMVATNTTASDLTLYSRPVDLVAVNNDLTFNVNMSFQEIQGNFNPGTDNVYVAGYFNGWGEPGTQMTDPDGDRIYTVVVDAGLVPPGQGVEYKFQFMGTDMVVQWEPTPNPDNAPSYNRIYTISSGLPETLAPVFFNNEGYAGSFAQDSLALVDLYNNNGGSSWITSDNWLTSEKLETWAGVTVAYGRVTELWLQYNDVSGNLQTSIGDLLALNALSFRSDYYPPTSKQPINKVNETFPEGDRVTDLPIKSNTKKASLYLTGLIPAEIGNLEHLTYLNLSGNQFSGAIPTQISNLINLETLYLGWNELTSVPASIENMEKLIRFSVRDNLMTDASIPVEIGNIPLLIYLNLIGNQFTKIPDSVFNLGTLEVLYISNNQITSIPSTISNLNSLQVLTIGRNPISSPLPGSITTLLNLYYLSLSDIGLTAFPTEINNMTQLTVLWLDNNQLTPTSMNGLETLTNLSSLDLSGNSLSSIPSPVFSLTNLNDLYFNNNLLTMIQTGELDPITNLYTLSLSDNAFTTFPTEILNKTSLEWLFLSGNQIAGALPDNISNLTGLYGLYLNGNSLEGALPSSITSMTYLQRLVIDYNRLTSIPDLTSLDDLWMLYVHGNQLDFSSIVPNMPIAVDGIFSYSQQDSLGTAQESLVSYGNNYTLVANSAYTGNLFQWYKDGAIMDGATAESYTIFAADYSNSGDYTCKITNPAAPDLTLDTRPHTVIVASVPDINNYDATEIKTRSVVLSADVNPGNLSTNVLFQYGETTAYGMSVEASQSPITGSTHLNVSALISGLEEGKTYYYRVEALNDLTVVQTSDGPNFTTPVYPTEINPIFTFIFPPPKNSPSDYQPGDYRLFSVPGNIDIPLNDVFTGIPGEEWTAYHDNGIPGQPNDFLEEFDVNNPFRFTPGRGFWVLSMADANLNFTTSSVAIDGEDYFHLPMHNGYNIIGDPFLLNVTWGAVQTINGISDLLYEFNNNTGTFNSVGEMEPFKAYYIRNASNLNDLSIPYIVNSKMKAPEAVMEWVVGIGIKSENIEEQLVSVGISKDVSQGQDKYDHYRPGKIGYHHGVFLVREEWDEDYPNFATDYREHVKQLEKWEFNVSTPDREETEIIFSGIGNVPELYDVVLIDYQRVSSFDLRLEGSYSFDPNYDDNRFAILVGHPEQVEEAIKTIVPQKFTLGKNYPNPFNPVTTIPIDIPANCEISLAVYDVLGKKVKTIYSGMIEQGRHFLKWHGDNDRGNSMPTGTYFYYLVIKGESAQTGKMVLMK